MTITNTGLPKVFKVGDIAEAADAPLWTIEQALRDGRFPNAWKLGGTTSAWRVPVGDVVAFLTGKAPPAPERPKRNRRQPQHEELATT
jgi:hypothetical protein